MNKGVIIITAPSVIMMLLVWMLYVYQDNPERVIAIMFAFIIAAITFVVAFAYAIHKAGEDGW